MDGRGENVGVQNIVTSAKGVVETDHLDRGIEIATNLKYICSLNTERSFGVCKVYRLCCLKDLNLTMTYTERFSPYRAVNTLAIVVKTIQLMLYREIVAVCSQIHTKHINTLCGQNVELLIVKLAVHTVTTGL